MAFMNLCHCDDLLGMMHVFVFLSLSSLLKLFRMCLFVSGNSKYLALTGGNLIVTSVNLNTDTGVYVCNGQNSIGNDSDTVVGKLNGLTNKMLVYLSLFCA